MVVYGLRAETGMKKESSAGKDCGGRFSALYAPKAVPLVPPGEIGAERVDEGTSRGTENAGCTT